MGLNSISQIVFPTLTADSSPESRRKPHEPETRKKAGLVRERVAFGKSEHGEKLVNLPRYFTEEPGCLPQCFAPRAPPHGFQLLGSIRMQDTKVFLAPAMC